MARSRLFFWPIEHHSDGKVVRVIFESVRHMGGTEEEITGADLYYLVFNPVAGGSSGDDINFVAQMRNLWPIGGASGKSKL
jgi:hypothetical protein